MVFLFKTGSPDAYNITSGLGLLPKASNHTMLEQMIWTDSTATNVLNGTFSHRKFTIILFKVSTQNAKLRF